jgi:hypothetical protein
VRSRELDLAQRGTPPGRIVKPSLGFGARVGIVPGVAFGEAGGKIGAARLVFYMAYDAADDFGRRHGDGLEMGRPGQEATRAAVAPCPPGMRRRTVAIESARAAVMLSTRALCAR